MGVVQDMKDGAINIALRKLISEKFSEYGVVEECSIDTDKNRLVLRALLHGEQSPITAVIDQYSVERQERDSYLVLHKVSASRVWLSLLLSQIAEGKRYKIPTAIGALL